MGSAAVRTTAPQPTFVRATTAEDGAEVELDPRPARAGSRVLGGFIRERAALRTAP